MGNGTIGAIRLGSVFLLVGALPAARWHNPVSSFTVSPPSAPPTLTVSVDGSASASGHGAITTYSWNWGDGSPAETTVTASHGYPATGTYAITLTVTDSKGLTASSTQTVHCITAGNSPPVAAINSATPASGDAPLDVAFAGQGTDNGTLAHRWTFGDGSPDAVFTGQVSGQVSGGNHTYAQPGTYMLRLTVMDVEGITSSSAVTIVAAAGGVPSASFSATPDSGPPPFLVDVDGSASFDGGGPIAAYSWDWGDGSPPSSGATSSHTYASTGTTTIRLTVTDNSGLTAWAERDVTTITAGNIPPTAVIVNAVPQAGPHPLDVAFLGFGHDNVGPLEHRWDFGDGTPPLVFPAVANHGTSSPTHVYAQPGTYVCRLRLKDAENVTSTSSMTVTVVDPVTSSERLGGGVCASSGLEVLAPLLFLWLKRRIS